MKRTVAILLSLVLICTCLTAALAEDENWTVIKGTSKATFKLKKDYGNNPAVEGLNSVTGLPSSGEAYTPLLMVLDNSPEAFPHWGVSQADIMFQIPNMGGGATKLLALFTDSYPEEAGGARSARACMLPVALAFDATFVYAGSPPLNDNSNADVDYLVRKWNLKNAGKSVDLLSGYSGRVDWYISPHNMTAYINKIHQDAVEKGVTYEERPFLFTDEKRTVGADANVVKMLFRGDSMDNPINSASTCTFTYDEDLQGYIRTSAGGDYSDRQNGEIMTFSNVVVVRVNFKYTSNYIYLENHMIGNGTAEIFQNGKYVRGAWSRKEGGRLVLIDQDGNELEMQRGKSFIVVTSATTEVKYY